MGKSHLGVALALIQPPIEGHPFPASAGARKGLKKGIGRLIDIEYPLLWSRATWPKEFKKGLSGAYPGEIIAES